MDYERWQTKALKEALTVRRVVLLAGARQCGKTTLTQQLADKDIEYRTLDDEALLRVAKDDPRGFLEAFGNRKTLVIDEIQKAPDLIPAIKMVVDKDKRAGQFLLTGSADIFSLPTVQESLAGRISKIRLRPLVQGEIENKKPRFLDRAFRKEFHGKSYTKKEILDFAFRGGFPEAIQLKANKRRAWHLDYIDAMIARDMKDVATIHKSADMRQLVSIMAAWSSKFMNISDIGTGLAIERKTLTSYIGILESLYLFDTVLPWVQTDYDRVGKKQIKIFMSDTGMMAAILGWTQDQVQLDSDRSGKLLETFVYNQLAAEIDTQEDAYRLYHYRDREKREIDFLVEHENHTLLGIEVKSSSTVKSSDFRHMRWFAENIAKKRLFLGIVLYTGEHVLPFGDGMWAVPIGALWD
jgi:predicted AAA+ superfamily ATPase